MGSEMCIRDSPRCASHVFAAQLASIHVTDSGYLCMGEGVADKTLGLERCGIVAIRLGSDTLSIGICASSSSCGREICRDQGPQDDMWWCDARCGNPHGGLHPMTIS